MFTQKRKLTPFVIWLFPVLFFSYQFILRLWPSLNMPQIMDQLAIDATGFGVLAAFYYYGYAGMQIPVAISLEKFGVRTVVSACAVLCALSALVFNMTDNFFLACLSRFCIGAGSAAGFLGVSKITTDIFPKDMYSRIIGLSFTVGLMGAIYGGKPVSLLIETYDRHTVLHLLALASVVIAALVFLCVRTRSARGKSQQTFKLTSLKQVCTYKPLWVLAVANLLMVGALEGFADVWGVPYLQTALNLDKPTAAELISFIFVGMLFGGPLLALLSQYVGEPVVLMLSGLGLAALFALILTGTIENWTILASVFFTIGVLCCYQVIVFSLGARLVDTHLLGITIAFLNCINMLGGSFFHTSIGTLMDIFEGTSNGSYSTASYTASLVIIPACAVVGAMMIAYLEFKSAHQSNKEVEKVT